MPKHLSGLFGDFDAARHQKLERIRKYAALTLPHVLQPLGQIEQQQLPQSFQSIGMFGSNSVKSTLMQQLFPAANPWYRFKLTEQFKLDSAGQIVPLDPQGLETADIVQLAETMAGVAEQTTYDFMETTTWRQIIGLAIESMAVTGNSLFRLNNDFSHRYWSLDQYVVTRDGEDRVTQIIIREKVDPYTLTKAIREKATLGLENLGQAHDEPASQVSEMLDMYTRVRWEPEAKVWTVLQQIRDQDIAVEAEEKVNPYIVSRWQAVGGDGYNYGIGIPEGSVGADLVSYDGIYRGILEGTAASVKHVFLVDPAGLVSRNQLAKAPNLAVLHGRGQDVDVVQTNKGADLRVALETADRLERRIGQAFALFTSVQRRAERVTSGETAAVLQELEGTFGNVFATMKAELQEPYLARFLWQLENNTSPDAPKLDRIDRDVIKPVVVTGLPALSREVELTKAMQALGVVGQLPGIAEKIDPRGVAGLVFRSMGVDPRGLIKSDEQLAIEAQAAQQAQLQAQAQEKAVDVVGNVAEQQAIEQGQPAG